ncbi:MAG: hypothetical protein ACI8TP_000607 [Acidimicrobiales bacterium]|jgi:hypothetical protein
MRRIVMALAVLVGVLGLTGPGQAEVPGAPYTDTGCDEYSDAVARLYVAAFGRTPEADGFNFWLLEYSTARWTLSRMADFFVASAEFEARYGAVDDEGFVTQLYENVLGRQPDANGLAFWVGKLADGMERGTLLLRFSESPENIERSGTSDPILGDFNAGTSMPFSCDGPDVIELCDAYLFYLGFSQTGDLAAALGDDAPVGLLAAIETLNDPDADIEDIFAAQASLSGYVTPVCRTRWDRGLDPAASNTAAVGTFFLALTTGDEAAAEPIAPDDVRAQFDLWVPIPDGELDTPSLSYGGGDSFNMLLAPTVTVFCQVSDGVVTSCAFGE